MTDLLDRAATYGGKVGRRPQRTYETDALLDDIIADFLDAHAIVSVACEAIENLDGDEEERWAATLVLRKGVEALEKVAAKLVEMKLSDASVHQGNGLRITSRAGTRTK